MSQAWDTFLSSRKLSPASRELYQVRMKSFLSFSGLTADEFAKLAPRETEDKILAYTAHLNARAENGEISKGTIRPCITPIKKFCAMNRMRDVDWKIVGETLPDSKKYASDRAPTLQEVKALLQHCPLRLKAAVLIQLSGGFRVGAFDYLNVGDVEDAGEGIAKVRIYRGEAEEYSTYITPEAYGALKEYLRWRETHGEKLTPESPLFRDVFDAGRGSKGRAEQVKRMSSVVFGRDVNRLWHKSGVWTVALDMGSGKRRQPFKATHGFRKAFKSIAEQHMKSLNVLRLMGHSSGVSGDSYYRPSEADVLSDYKKAVPFLTVSEELRQVVEIAGLKEKHGEQFSELKVSLFEKDRQIEELRKAQEATNDFLAQLVNDPQMMATIRKFGDKKVVDVKVAGKEITLKTRPLPVVEQKD